MFFSSFRTQFSFAIRQKITLATFGLLFVIVGLNFVGNVLTFQGMDITTMYHPMKLLVLSYNRIYHNADNTLLLIQLYPLLVACPAGLLYAKEWQIGLNTLVGSRVGALNYNLSKLAAVFCATAIVFTLPFMIEILLNIVAFPTNAIGDLSNLNTYDPSYLQSIKNYIFCDLYLVSPYLYAVVMTILFGILSGILGMTICAFSMTIHVKFRLLYLLPIYIFLNFTIYILPNIADIGAKLEWYHYYLLFNDERKSVLGFFIVQVILIVYALMSAYYGSRKDCVK